MRYLILLIMTMNLYTTPQASDLTGIPEGTIRSWLSRHVDVFQIDVHVVIEKSGRKLWTEQGIELLRSRAATNDASESATCNAANSDAVGDEILEPLLDAAAEAMAYQFFEQLPNRVVARIRQMMTNPDESDREKIRESVQAVVSAGAVYLLPPNPHTKRITG